MTFFTLIAQHESLISASSAMPVAEPRQLAVDTFTLDCITCLDGMTLQVVVARKGHCALALRLAVANASVPNCVVKFQGPACRRA